MVRGSGAGRRSIDMLRTAALRRLFLARVLASLAASAAPILLAFAVLDVRDSAFVLGAVLAARSLPQVALVLVGGVLADRLPRHRIALASLGVATASQAAVAALILTGEVRIWTLVVLEAVNGAATAFLAPATEALTVAAVPGRELRAAVTVIRIGVTTATMAGAALAGVLLAVVGTGWGFVVDAVAFGLAAAFMTQVSSSPVDRGERRRPVQELLEGWGEFRARRWLLVVVCQFFVVNAVLAGAWSTLGPTIAERGFGRAGWGVVSAALTVGMVLGGLVALRVQSRHPLRQGVGLTLLVAPALLVLGLAPSVPALVLAVLVGGAAIEMFEISWQVSISENVPESRLSRVFAFEQLGTFAAIPIGQIVAGPLAIAMGTDRTVVAGAVLTVVTAVWARSSRSVRTLERVDPPAHLPHQSAPVGEVGAAGSVALDRSF